MTSPYSEPDSPDMGESDGDSKPGLETNLWYSDGKCRVGSELEFGGWIEEVVEDCSGFEEFAPPDAAVAAARS
jgi:hypothetical protein